MRDHHKVVQSVINNNANRGHGEATGFDGDALKQVEGDMARQEMDPSSEHYRVQLFEGSTYLFAFFCLLCIKLRAWSPYFVKLEVL